MATKKDSVIKQSAADYLNKFNQDYVLVRSAWFVFEYRPAETYDGMYVPSYSREISGEFATKEEAEQWAEGWEPDKGCTFLIKERFLREYKVTKWFNV